MNIFQRLFPKHERKANPAYRAILSTYGSGTPIWTPRDYGNLTRAGYQSCATVFACVSKIAKGASRIGWTLGNRQAGGDMNEIEEHPLLALLTKPNESEGGSRFVEKALSFLLLAGNSYILKVHGVQSMPPQFLYALRPDRMKIVAGTWKEPVSRYEYSPGAAIEKFEARDILHLMEFHPTNDFYGLSRLEVAARAIDISNKSMEWNKKLLDNDMRPSGIITLDPALMQEQFDLFVTKFTEQYSGHGNAGSVPIFNGGVEWQATGLNPKDIDWTVGQREIMRQICTIFDVCSQLLGDTENTTYSNMQEARKALYMEAILPFMDLLRDELNAWLVPLYGDGLYLDYDRDEIEALQEDQAQQYAYVAQADWLTVNEKRSATGYDEVGPEGDVILVGIGKIPLEQAVAEPEPVPDALSPFAGGDNADEGDEEPQDEEEPEAEGSGAEGKDNAPTGLEQASRAIPEHKATGYWAKPELKERLWLTFEARVKTREKSFEQMAKSYLRAQADALRQKASKLISTSGIIAADIFSINEEAKRYARTFTPWYIDHFIRAGNAGMRASKGELFDDGEFKSLAWKGDPKKPTSWVFTMTPAQDAKLKDMIFKSGTKVSETTLEIVERMIHEANDSGWTVQQFAQNLSDKATDLGPWRSRLWARTESAKVDSFGAVEGMRETEFVERKGWLCSFVPDSREEHIAADGQEVDLDDDFIIGKERLGYPGDPKGSAGMVCNCLCSVYPVVGEVGGGG
jgi:HK97 family phage portal protein